MYSLLLVIIYIAFISLGLPDSLIGSAWPVMHMELNVPVSYAGIITMIISGGTIVSSLTSDRVTRKFGAGLVTAVSVLMTAVALFGFSVSHSFIFLCIWAIPYGLGAGAVDAALNNYVALHYKSKHMSWLHCFWGVGAAISPYIMSFCLVSGFGWNNGFLSVSVIQICLVAILFVTLPLWKQNRIEVKEEEHVKRALSLPQILSIKGVPFVLISFLAYGALEQTAGLWASSYLVEYREVPIDVAARFASLFYLGITFGRFLCGFVADKFGDKMLIRIGVTVSGIGVIFILLPISSNLLALAGLIVVGFGCAPIYPSIIHSTPFHFGKENSQAVIGVQMASAYVGTTLMPPLFGAIASIVGIGIYPVYLLIFVLLMLVMSERLNQVMKHKM